MVKAGVNSRASPTDSTRCSPSTTQIGVVVLNRLMPNSAPMRIAAPGVTNGLGPTRS